MGSLGYKEKLEDLKADIEQQRGMLWLFGEIMKSTINITSFRELVSVLNDILMGVMGVTTCYLWYESESIEPKSYILFYRSTELKNEFRRIRDVQLPRVLASIKDTYLYTEEEIEYSLVEDVKIPGSRLAIPLKRFKDDTIQGIIVLEHEEKDFFTKNLIVFFEILIVFIESKVENIKLFEKVAEKSIKDPLTGSYNRGYLQEALKEFEKKYKHITVAVVDIDDFKTINDELGHTEGDTVLKAIAQLATGIASEADGIVIRYGGDEFVILIPRALEEAVYIFEEFRSSVHYLKIVYDLSIDISATLGVCSYPEIIKDYAKIVKVADEALLKGKVKGKNRVVLATSECIELD